MPSNDQVPLFAVGQREMFRQCREESFFPTCKKELIHTRPWPTTKDLQGPLIPGASVFSSKAYTQSALSRPGGDGTDLPVVAKRIWLRRTQQ